MIVIIGILGAICLGACGLPQVIMSYRQKHSRGIAHGFLAMWTAGEVLYLIYGLITGADWVLVVNYVINLLLLTIIIYYKVIDHSDPDAS